MADNEFYNLFRDVKLCEMKSCLFTAPHSFDDDEVDEDMQLTLMEFSCDSVLKKTYQCQVFIIYSYQHTFRISTT